jgi:hypothetical protein
MFAKASSSVAPCDQHPGSPGQETLYPSSVCIKATEYFTNLTLAFQLEDTATASVRTGAILGWQIPMRATRKRCRSVRRTPAELTHAERKQKPVYELRLIKAETLSLSLRLRVARSRATGDLFGICPAFVKLLSSTCQAFVQCPSGVYSQQIPGVGCALWTTL